MLPGVLGVVEFVEAVLFPHPDESNIVAKTIAIAAVRNVVFTRLMRIEQITGG